MKVDAFNERLYICVVSGWMSVAGGGGTEPPSNCSDYDETDAATCSAAGCRWNKKKLTCN
jgi:hypothetical protein